jgi:hypothetical protein
VSSTLFCLHNPRVVLNSVAAEPLRTIAHRVIARSSGAGSWAPAVLRQALAAAPLSLFLHQRPDAIPVGTWGGVAELCDAFQEQLARRVAWDSGEAVLKPGKRLFPILASIGIKRLKYFKRLSRDGYKLESLREGYK